MWSVIRPSLTMFAILTIITGLFYPLWVTGLAQALFPDEAAGSFVVQDGKIVGSSLIGQAFDDPKYFWGRPSVTAPQAYNAAASTGSNLGPTNPALFEAVKNRMAAFTRSSTASPSNTTIPRATAKGSTEASGSGGLVPVELVTASGSGLDPHISPAAAIFQVARVAHSRGLSESDVRRLVEELVEDRTFGVLGEPRVNVLRLNLALDRLAPAGT